MTAVQPSGPLAAKVVEIIDKIQALPVGEVGDDPEVVAVFAAVVDWIWRSPQHVAAAQRRLAVMREDAKS